MTLNQYKHLEITVSPQIMQKIKLGRPPFDNGPRFFALKKWIGSNSIIQKVSQKAVAYASLSGSEKGTQRSIELLNSKVGENAHDFDSPYGYEDDIYMN